MERFLVRVFTFICLFLSPLISFGLLCWIGITFVCEWWQKAAKSEERQYFTLKLLWGPNEPWKCKTCNVENDFNGFEEYKMFNVHVHTTYVTPTDLEWLKKCMLACLARVQCIALFAFTVLYFQYCPDAFKWRINKYFRIEISI